MNGLWSIVLILGMGGVLALLLGGRRRRYGHVHVVRRKPDSYDLRTNVFTVIVANAPSPVTAKAVHGRLRKRGMPADRQIKDVERVLDGLVNNGAIQHRLDRGSKHQVYFFGKEGSWPAGYQAAAPRRHQGW